MTKVTQRDGEMSMVIVKTLMPLGIGIYGGSINKLNNGSILGVLSNLKDV